MLELISIIVPIYNVQEYLYKCIESILNQSYKNIEVILIDDGSVDKSPIICDDFAALDNRIVVIHTQNKGVSSARNLGMNVAKGKYVGFVDADDYIEKDMFKILYEKIKKDNSDMVMCDVYIENTKKSIYKIYDENYIFNKDLMAKNLFNNSGFNWLCNKLFKMEIVQYITLNESIHMGEDILFICEYICKGSKYSYISIPLYHYMIRVDSACNSEFNYKKLTNIKAYECILDIYLENICQYKHKALQAYVIANINVICWIIEGKYIDYQLINNIKKDMEKIIKENNAYSCLSLKCKINLILLKINTKLLYGVKKLNGDIKKIFIKEYKRI